MDFLKDLSVDKLRNAAEDAFNQVKPKSEVEARVYEVLSHKNWGSSSTLLNEIARDTYEYDRFPIITGIMWDSMQNQRPSAWRVVFKGLMLLEHLIKNGNERCVDDARNHSHVLRSLNQFNYYEGTVDRGLGVREKAKQLIELLGDDERIREERQKAKTLREKFGSSAAGVGGGGGGGGMGSSSKYAGYGNSDQGWKSGGGGGGGYGESGIGSKSSGYGNDSGGGYAGRYADDSAPSSSSYGNTKSSSATPTFATMPSDDMPSSSKKKSKSKKLKKKKKEKSEAAQATIAPVPAAAPAAPEVDLFSFDSAAAPAPATTTDASFDAFQSAPAPLPAVAPAPVAANDDFANFQSAPVPAAPTVAAAPTAQFDAFGTTQSTPMPVAAAPISNANNTTFDAFGSIAAPANNMSAMNNAFGNMSMQQPSAPAPTVTNNNDDDDFGDFDDGQAQTNTSQPSNSSNNGDPLSRLISLDSLTKNANKPKSTLNEPIVANPAAAQYVHNQQQGVQTKVGNNPSMSFQGIDGLGGTTGMSIGSSGGMPGGMNTMGGENNYTPASSSGGGGMVMGAPKAGGANAIDAMSPENMGMNKKPAMPTNAAGMTPQQQQQMMMMQQQQRMMMMQQQGMMGGQQGQQPQQGNMMMGGMQQQQPQQGNMMMGGMGGMQQQQQQAQQGNMMMGGGNMQQQPQQGMMMGGQPQMMGGTGNMMGGQPMGGGGGQW